MKKKNHFEFRVNLTVAKVWIDDGFDASERLDQIREFFEGELIPYAAPGVEVVAEVALLTAPVKLFSVFKCDDHHSNASMQLIAVVGSMVGVMGALTIQAKKEGQEITFDDQEDIYNKKQTQHYRGEGQFYVIESELDKMIE